MKGCVRVVRILYCPTHVDQPFPTLPLQEEESPGLVYAAAELVEKDGSCKNWG